MYTLEIKGLLLTGSTHTIQLSQPAGATWILLSEVQFFGPSACGSSITVQGIVPVLSYSMLNGAVKATCTPASQDFADNAYTGSGSPTTVTGGALSGGTGLLTDGVVPRLAYSTMQGYQYVGTLITLCLISLCLFYHDFLS